MLKPIDELPLAEALAAFAAADRTAAAAAAAVDAPLATLIPRVVAAWQAGGRLLMSGAGTSGRLVFQQAAECRPTFGLDERTVAARIAGGPEALVQAREGAEDDAQAGRAAWEELGGSAADIALGVSASGSTPFVRGFLAAAAASGAATVLLSSAASPAIPAELQLCTPTGPELVSGSTRMKAATAHKCVLDRLTTLAACGIGRVRRGLMHAMRPTNAKLRRRALAIVQELAECSEEEAARRLAAADGDIEAAVQGA